MMAKKVSFLMCFILLLTIVSNAFGEIIKWDNDSGDNLWKTALNWDLNRVPSIADTAQIVRQEPGGCIIDANHTDKNAAEVNQLRLGKGSAGDLRMTGGYLTCTGTVQVGMEALGRFYMDGGTVTIYGNTGISISDTNNGNFMTITGGSYISPTPFTKQIVIGKNGGTGTLNMIGGAIDYGGMHIGKRDGIGTLNMQGGTINLRNLSVGKTEALIPGTGTLTMTGGVINIAENLKVGLDGSTGHLQLDGGTIYANNLEMGTAGSADPCGTMDIKAGTLIINGNSTDLIAGYMNDPNGWITADDGTGNVIMDYDIRNPGKTTLTATSGDANLPRLTINVEPNTINTDSIVPPITEPIYYWEGQTISIGAGPSKNCPFVYRFHHWEGDVADPNSPSTIVFMDEDKTVTAVFFEDERICGDECHPILQGDLNADCHVDLTDFSIYASEWLSCTHPDCDEL